MDHQDLRHYRGPNPYLRVLKYGLYTADCFHEVAKRFEAKESRQFRASLVALYRRYKRSQNAKCRNLLKNHPIQGKVVIAAQYLGALFCGAGVFYVQSLIPSEDVLARLPVSTQFRGFLVVWGIASFYMCLGGAMWRNANKMRVILRTIR